MTSTGRVALGVGLKRAIEGLPGVLRKGRRWLAGKYREVPLRPASLRRSSAGASGSRAGAREAARGHYPGSGGAYAPPAQGGGPKGELGVLAGQAAAARGSG